MLEGTLDFELGPERETIRLPAGSYVAAPPKVAHSFRNDGNGRARFLNFHAPSGGFADYLRALRDGEDGSWFDQLDPPADGGGRLSDGAVLGLDEGEEIDVGRSSVLLKGTGASSDGMFFLSETTVEPGLLVTAMDRTSSRPAMARRVSSAESSTTAMAPRPAAR